MNNFLKQLNNQIQYNKNFIKNTNNKIHEGQRQQAKMNEEYNRHKAKNDAFFKKFNM